MLDIIQQNYEHELVKTTTNNRPRHTRKDHRTRTTLDPERYTHILQSQSPTNIFNCYLKQVEQTTIHGCCNAS